MGCTEEKKKNEKNKEKKYMKNQSLVVIFHFTHRPEILYAHIVHLFIILFRSFFH